MPKFKDDFPGILRESKRIRVKMKNFRQDKVLIGGMAANVTRYHKNRLQSMKIKSIGFAANF